MASIDGACYGWSFTDRLNEKVPAPMRLPRTKAIGSTSCKSVMLQPRFKRLGVKHVRLPDAEISKD